MGELWEYTDCYSGNHVDFLNICPLHISESLYIFIKSKLDKRPVVPVIIDKSNGSAVLDDSYRIALHLEEKYPDSPSLFHGGIGVHDFFQNYADHHIILPIFKLVLLDICKLSGPPDLQEWFRKDRESKFGITLEEFAGDTDANVSDLKTALYPIVKLLEKSDYITGSQGNVFAVYDR